MNEKNAWLRSLFYIMQIVNIHKQAELTKTMDLTVPLFIEESNDGPMMDMYLFF